MTMNPEAEGNDFWHQVDVARIGVDDAGKQGENPALLRLAHSLQPALLRAGYLSLTAKTRGAVIGFDNDGDFHLSGFNLIGCPISEGRANVRRLREQAPVAAALLSLEAYLSITDAPAEAHGALELLRSELGHAEHDPITPRGDAE